MNIAIVGLGVGAEFIPIYQRYPGANMYAICQRTEKTLNEIGDQFGVEKRYTSYEDLLADPNVDAVHINTPIPLHGQQSIRSEEHTSELQSRGHLVCRLLLEK